MSTGEQSSLQIQRIGKKQCGTWLIQRKGDGHAGLLLKPITVTAESNNLDHKLSKTVHS